MKSTVLKTISLLSPAKRRAAIILLGLVIIGALFEVLGVGMLLPVITLLMSEDLAANYPVLQPVLDSLGNPDRETQVKYVLFGLIAVYAVKNIYLSMLAWWNARFTIGLQIDFSQRLFTFYLRQPYHFHLQRNSAHLIRNVTGEVAQFTSRAIKPMLNLVAEALVLASILVLLVAVEPLGSIVVFLLLLSASWLFYRSMRARVTRWGLIRQYHDGQRIQHLQQGLGGVKDVKLLGRETEFLSIFNKHNSKSGQMARSMEVLQKLPRLWLEILAVSGFVLLVFLMMAQGKQMSSIVPIMGLFAAAAFRLMPSLNRILVAMQALRYGIAAVENLYQDLNADLGDASAGKGSCDRKTILNEEIRLDVISYSYPQVTSTTLNSIDVIVRKGGLVGIIGPSGSGKSTLVDLILGLLTPDSGKVLVDGQDIQQNLRGWQDQIGYVPQEIYLTDDSLRRNIAFGLPENQIDDKAVARAVQAAQLDEYISSLPDGLDTEVGERGVKLSGGQRQRIGIARALYHDPEVLVLDEATSALDMGTEAGFMQAIMALHGNKTVIIVAHRLSTVENCDHLYRLENGEVVEQGEPGQIISKLNIPTRAG